MNLTEFKKQQMMDYKANNGIEASHISTKVLWQCRPLLPEVKIVGKSKNNIIFFEETSGSLQKRHYGKSDKVTSYNLLYNNGKETKKVTAEYLKDTNIVFNENYDIEILNNFIKNNNNRFNALENEKRNKYCLFLSDNEIEAVKELVKRMREIKQ